MLDPCRPDRDLCLLFLRRANFRQHIWLPALQAAGLPTIHIHDLRHTGNALTANAGANLRELMARMGDASTRAALVSGKACPVASMSRRSGATASRKIAACLALSGRGLRLSARDLSLQGSYAASPTR